MNAQFEQCCLVVEAGTAIDATLALADAKRPPMREVEAFTTAPAAGFTRRGQRSFFGYEPRPAVDQAADPFTQAILTGVDIAESVAADAPIRGDQAAVPADKAKRSTTRREAQADAGMADRLAQCCHERSPCWHEWMNLPMGRCAAGPLKISCTIQRRYVHRRLGHRLTRDRRPRRATTPGSDRKS